MASRSDKRFGMVVDARVCVGCSACVIACKGENDVPDGRARRWVVEMVEGRFPHLKMTVFSDCCQHCDDPPCVTTCPTGASYVESAMGTTQVDHELCTGCKACVASCPYDARYIHPVGTIDKCTLCVHRLARGESTACEEICPTGAIVVGDLNSPRSEINEMVRTRHTDQQRTGAGTRPRFYLAN